MLYKNVDVEIEVSIVVYGTNIMVVGKFTWYGLIFCNENINYVFLLKYLNNLVNRYYLKTFMNLFAIKNLVILFYPFIMNGQITNIPDPTFEEILIYKGIDSDNTINGQILTSDITSITQLDFEFTMPNTIFPIYSLEGIQYFSNLNFIKIAETEIAPNSVNIGSFPLLQYLSFKSNGVSSIDLSSNTLLTHLDLGNSAIDVGNHNMLTSLDLSSNININYLSVYNTYTLQQINLKNNISNNLFILLSNEMNYPHTVCLEVDDPNSATNNLPPYNNWTIYGNYFFSNNCTLSNDNFIKNNYKIYPNPTSEYVFIEENIITENKINSIQILGINGQLLKNIDRNFEKIYVGDLEMGTYILIINTNKGNKVERFVKK